MLSAMKNIILIVVYREHIVYNKTIVLPRILNIDKLKTSKSDNNECC